MVLVGTNIGCRKRPQQVHHRGEVQVVQTMVGSNVINKVVEEDTLQICCENNV